MSRPKANFSTLQEAWLDGASDRPCYWAIIVPPLATTGIHNTDPARRACYIVAGKTAEQAEAEAKRHTRLFNFWDDLVTECKPTTKPLTEIEVRTALRKRGYVVQIVVRLDAHNRYDGGKARPSTSVSVVANSPEEFPACWGA